MAGFSPDLMLQNSRPPRPKPPGTPSRAVLAGDPYDFTDRYNTPIPPNRQAEFDQWAERQKALTGKDPRRDRYDYDIQGDWLAGAHRDERGHGTDKFKKPNHPTFSIESIYHGADGFEGGRWYKQNGKAFYQATPTNLRFHGDDELQRYFKEREPETELLLPQKTK